MIRRELGAGDETGQRWPPLLQDSRAVTMPEVAVFCGRLSSPFHPSFLAAVQESRWEGEKCQCALHRSNHSDVRPKRYAGLVGHRLRGRSEPLRQSRLRTITGGPPSWRD